MIRIWDLRANETATRSRAMMWSSIERSVFFYLTRAVTCCFRSAPVTRWVLACFTIIRAIQLLTTYITCFTRCVIWPAFQLPNMRINYHQITTETIWFSSSFTWSDHISELLHKRLLFTSAAWHWQRARRVECNWDKARCTATTSLWVGHSK